MNKRVFNILRKQAGWREILTSAATTGAGATLVGFPLYYLAKALGASNDLSVGLGLAGAFAGGYGGNRLGKKLNRGLFTKALLAAKNAKERAAIYQQYLGGDPLEIWSTLTPKQKAAIDAAEIQARYEGRTAKAGDIAATQEMYNQLKWY